MMETERCDAASTRGSVEERPRKQHPQSKDELTRIAVRCLAGSRGITTGVRASNGKHKVFVGVLSNGGDCIAASVGVKGHNLLQNMRATEDVKM